MRNKHQKTGKILKVNLSSTNTSEVLDFVSSSLTKYKKFFIVTPNPEIIVEAQKNPKLLKALNSADISLADGAGLIIAAELFSLNTIRRIRGREMMIELFKLGNKNKYKIFLLGSTPETIKLSIKRLVNRYPNIRVEGTSGPKLDNKANPVSEVDVKLQSDALDKINIMQPNLLFVAFGAPKQELWVQKHLKNLKIGGAMVVGGSLDYFSGTAKLPPKLLANWGLEWLWRVMNEPKRIKRIFNAIVVFSYLIFKEKLAKILKNGV